MPCWLLNGLVLSERNNLSKGFNPITLSYEKLRHRLKCEKLTNDQGCKVMTILHMDPEHIGIYQSESLMCKISFIKLP